MAPVSSKPTVAELTVLLSNADTTEILPILQGYTPEELRQGLPQPQIRAPAPFAWHDDTGTLSNNLITREEKSRVLQLFDNFFRANGFPAQIQARGVPIPMENTFAENILYQTLSLAPETPERVDLTIKWNSPSKFLQWWVVQSDVRSPYDTPVEQEETNVGEAQGTPPSLRDWLRARLGNQQLAGNVSHEWGYFSFNYTVRVTGPERQTAAKPVTLPMQPAHPFRWESQLQPKRPRWVNNDIKNRAVRVLDGYFSDGYPPRKRPIYNYDYLTFPFFSETFDLYPENANNAENPATVLLYVDATISVGGGMGASWWPLQGNVQKPYKTPVWEMARNGEEMTFPSLHDWIHDRLGVRGFEMGGMFHAWDPQSVMFKYWIYQTSSAKKKRRVPRVLDDIRPRPICLRKRQTINGTSCLGTNGTAVGLG